MKKNDKTTSLQEINDLVEKFKAGDDLKLYRQIKKAYRQKNG